MHQELLRPIARVALLLSVAAAGTACATSGSSTTQLTSGLVPGVGAANAQSQRVWRERAAGHGSTQELHATFDQSWEAVHAALKWNHAGTAVDYFGEGEEGYVITNANSPSATPKNTQIGAWIDPMSADKVELTVVVLGSGAYAGGPSERQLLQDIDTAAGLLEVGQPLPDTRP